ncbi:hypothetical protein CAPTEDRAFT_85937, partial [Capitella teleta]
DMFTCRDGTCIMILYVCDGQKDCLDGEDEECNHLCSYEEGDMVGKCNQDCHTSNCTCISTHFQCSSGGCVPLEKLCDGRTDCADDSDEEGCALMLPITEQIEYFTCASGRACRHSYCIPLHRVCDGIYDCPMKDDEDQCTNLVCVGLFKCKNGTCLHPKLLCNGVVECPQYGDDE